MRAWYSERLKGNSGSSSAKSQLRKKEYVFQIWGNVKSLKNIEGVIPGFVSLIQLNKS